MLRIIYGAAGCGKSNRIYDLLKEDAQGRAPSYLIVPEQETVRCERKLLDILPPSSQLTTEVLNFSRLANSAFRKFGGISYNYASKGSKTLIMWKNLKDIAPLLTEYSKAAKENGSAFATEMLSAVGELKAYCVSPQRLENAAGKINDDPILKNKLLDLSLIMASYQNYLSQSFSDSSDDLSKLARVIRDTDFLNGINVYIDSFTSFTAQEFEVIEAICRSAKNVTISLTLDSVASTQIHYECTLDTLISLKSIAKKLSIEIKEEALCGSSTSSAALCAIATSLWDPSLEGLDAPGSDEIRIVKCKNPYEEAEAAANIIRKLLMQGLRCRDIAIIARDPSIYRGIIDNALSKAHIPYFLSENSDIMSKPLIKFILSALRIKLYNFRSEDVISYLKSGFSGIDERDVDLFECYLSTWNLRASAYLDCELTMNPDGYSEHLTERGKEILRRVNYCKNSFVPPLSELLARLDSAKNATEMCAALYSFMEGSGIASKLSEKAEKDYECGHRREAAELLQLYNSLVGALENISASLDDSPITVREFFDALRIMLDSISLGAIPTAEDQVIIGSAAMLRVHDVKCTILIGLNEGEFPKTVKESGVFSDRDKQILGELGITLSPNTQSRSSDELFYVYRAMSSPSERLILLYHSSDLSGNATPASIGVERLKKLFANLEVEDYSTFPISDTLMSRELAFEKLPLIQNTPEGHALSEYFSSADGYAERRALAEIPSQNKECRLGEETLKDVYGSGIRLTQSIIDRYVGCPFEYMCQRLLDLNDIKQASFDYSSFGTYIHYIFENYLKRAVDDGMVGKQPDGDYIDRVVNDCADKYLSTFFPNGELESPRLVHRFNRMRRLAVLVATNITREFADSSFRPEFFELSIGRTKDSSYVSPLSFNTTSGNKITLVGKVDRIDILRRDSDIFVRVIDYKSGKKAFSEKDIKKGLNVQLPLYLFALCDESQVGFRDALGVPRDQKLTPAGAMYLSSLVGDVEVAEDKYDRERVIESAEASIIRSGFLTDDIEILKEMSHELSPQYLCGAKRIGSSALPANFLSSEGMLSLQNELRATVSDIADMMAAGNMSPSPSFSNNAYRCENCQMKAVCRASLKNQ